ncbi:MAG: T9SS type A sorting domain-containing protein [Bacteroidetes bacterium]|nr:T9SS type A sorting domain-containing protein [Bacteroidota bacterium]
MRSALPAFVFVALSIQTQAQLWEMADQRSEEINFEQALPIGGNRWAVIGKTSFAGNYLISVRHVDGTVAWENDSMYSTSNGAGSVVLMPDSGLLHAGSMDGCDYFWPECLVRRYAPDGTLLWERMITSEEHVVTMAAKGSISHVALASTDTVYILDLNGNTTGGFPVPANDVQAILWAGDTSLTMLRGLNIQIVGLDGAIQASEPLGPSFVDMVWQGGQLFVLANDSIRRYTAALALAGIAPLANTTSDSKFTTSENGLYIGTSTGLYQVDSLGVPSLLFPWPTLPDYYHSACVVRDSTVLAVGNTFVSGRGTGIIRALSMGGEAAQHDEDVELLLDVDSVWVQPSAPYWDRMADITGLVVNHGTDTLRSVVVSMWYDVPMVLCSYPVNRIDSSGFALPPGDTLSLPFGTVYVARGLYQGQQGGTDDICAVALAPNALADRATEDNMACSTVDFPLGIKTVATQGQLFITPNPATDRCVLSGLGNFGSAVHVQIMDGTGRILSDRSLRSSLGAVELDVSSLSPGTYVLIAEGGRKRAFAKLVVARF